ncbi:peptide MFS transporter [Neiella sp. HB171785]|uniref:Peptide MFS transporter n=1 Tax=Neiella litorisoli TaxID=2771431 RepID=A0A8J6UJ34_9GAMM|nr:peptide MFS transporter [Neiella litorisoli]MBD1389823.1 peptide MFS transporter [Neiella litorisoli]
MSQLPTNKTMFGHPAGLFLLFGTELWERFSYYAMRAILVLYLADKSHGLGWSEGDALKLYATFTGLVYITPLIGGWLADNFLGQRKAILIGGTLMAAGQFTLAAPHAWVPGAEVTVFYVGLALLIAGNGMFKPNISTMVGDLYEEGDHRRDGAFTIFYMGINVGAFLSGIVVGSVVAAAGGSWQAGFACAGAGMVLSLIIQLTFARKLLGDIGTVPAATLSKQQQTEERKAPLTKEEFDRIKVIFILGVFTIIFWAGFEQAGGLMNIYADRFTDRMVGSFEVPTTWFQSLNPFFIVICAPIIAMIWTRMGDKEPTSPVKFGLGLVLLAIGFVFMIGATLQQGGDINVKTSMMWLVGAYFFHTMGELCLSPIGLSMVTKLAPLRLASVLMGVWFGFTGLANYVAGFVGSFIGHGDEANMVDNALSIFAGIAITATISGIILFLFANKLVYWMHGAEGSSHDKLEEELETAGQHQ